ncbi:adenosine 3'-phospho 5'-phosphosulfate transporter 1 isoform X1 [Daphnia magna]|uniref:adenosine 3'-phospho 5'-phosphosulfate transporter 1 isoform X1 n=1 Tax=Daphnia magna TaxID=35525 RepID=UPI001E1BCEDF|nr:adenosine 3'-phospho 5'-phosphosulfate transporter 1 isoform X1 [Daphnia magna]
MTWAEMYPSSATVSDDLEEKETTSWTSQGRGGSALVITTGIATWVVSLIISNAAKLIIDENGETSWILRFIFTILGYTTVFLPCYVLIHLSQRHNLHTLGGCQWRLLRLILTGTTSEIVAETDITPTGRLSNTNVQTLYQKALSLFYCCAGLQVSYLLWGLLQEKIMTREYTDGDKIERFTDSQFLVFVNRILAFLFSGIYLLLTHQNVHRTPLYKYSFCSVSNTLSSWCQYEALKFVSFPTQVLAKSAKVIPVMLMGKLVSRAQYKNYEYTTAVLISVGMTAFLLGSGGDKKGNNVTTVSGAVLLCGYLIFDSFTANWQSALFKEHKPSSIQMMCGVNLMSCLFTSASLIQQGGFFYSLSFAARHPIFIMDCLLTAISSASGQLFIFATISKFGPVVFTIIMTVRQGLSILLSCLLYQHHLSPMGILGVFIVFLAIFLRMYYAQQHRKRKLEASEISESKV